MGKNYTYVENSNVFIKGSRVSAVARGLPGATNIYEAMNNRVVDLNWRMDYGRLHSFVCGDEPSRIGAANLWGSPPPPDSFWEMVRRHNFKVETFDRNAQGKEKKMDVAIAHRITKDAYRGVIRRGEDEITLVSGDKDFVPVVKDLALDGFRIHIVFWNHAADELKSVATRLINLDPYLDMLTKRWQA